MPTIRMCPRCRSTHYGNPSTCNRCGHVFRKPGLNTRQGVILAVVFGLIMGGLALLFLWLPDQVQTPPVSRSVPSPAPPQARPAGPSDSDPNLKSVIHQSTPAVVRIDVVGAGERAVGSGFVVNTTGHVLTNQHVIAGGGRIVITAASGTQVEATVRHTDAGVDLALLEAPGLAGTPTLKITSASHLEQGDRVVALGSPEGFTNSVSDGIISALDRTIRLEDGGTLSNLIQTTAPISHGSSGGPLVEVATGHVIGVTTAGSDTGAGLGFAVSGDTILATLERWGGR